MRHATRRQLQVFEAVARLSSFSRAAEALHLTQPAVSTQVKQLEGHTGLPLFEQLGKRIYLTQAGAELLIHARTILEQFRAADEALARLKGVAGGQLNVAVISAGDYFFPRLLAEFTRVHPGVVLNLGVFNREQLLRQLADNLTDLAVMVRPPHDLDTVDQTFAPHPYVIVAAPTHPLVGLRQLRAATVLKEAFIVRERGSDTWNSMQDAFGKRLERLRVAMEIGSNETIKQAVMAGMGISFLSAHAISLELQLGKLAVLDVEGFPKMLDWYVVHRRQKQLPPVALAFKQFLLDEGAALLGELVRTT